MYTGLTQLWSTLGYKYNDFELLTVTRLFAIRSFSSNLKQFYLFYFYQTNFTILRYCDCFQNDENFWISFVRGFCNGNTTS